MIDAIDPVCSWACIDIKPTERGVRRVPPLFGGVLYSPLFGCMTEKILARAENHGTRQKSR